VSALTGSTRQPAAGKSRTTARGDREIRVGVVGTGFGGKIHVPVLQRLAGVRVAGVAGAHQERTEEVARSLGLDHAYTSWEQLLEDDSLTAVTIAVPPARQHEVVLAAIRKGKHVLCEKPFGTSAAQAREMLDAATAAGVIHMVDYLFRMAPEFERLRALAQTGAIGTIHRVNVEWTLPGRVTRNPPWSWHVDADAGGSTLFAFGSHVIDYIEWLFGPIGAVSAHLSTRKPLRDGGAHRAAADDTVDAIFILRDDTPVSMSLSTATPGGRGQWISVYGDRGALVGNHAAGRDV
jgi:predicted dehydrogenase